MRVVVFLLMALLVSAGSRAADPCPGACSVELGEYSASLPEGAGPFPVLLHLHGMGGSGRGVARGGTARAALRRGYALIAPTGWQPSSRHPKNWGVADGRDYTRDDIAFLRQVLDDAASRWPIDRERVLLSGFSRGGSMVWDVACRAPDLARAFAPVAGAFWDRLPERCARPVDLFHTHGWLDRTVPLEGRRLADGTLTQGDVWASLFILREINGCTARQPKTSRVKDGNWWRHWTDCRAGRIDLMLHPGGHSLPKGWVDRSIDWFEARTAAGPAS
jgi:polyhydroxybutyrate depolymerase